MEPTTNETHVSYDSMRASYALALRCPRIPWTARVSSPLRYYTQNEWFPVSDAWLLARMIQMYRPANILEVGSGFSTAVMLDACETNRITTHITCIDPRLRRVCSLIHSNDQVELMETPVQIVSMSRFDGLNRGDILFIDSSHVDGEGTDVDFLVRRVLPRLKAGVLVHFHDIFPDFTYPAHWALRGYSEAPAVASLLKEHSSRYRVVAFNSLAGLIYASLFRMAFPEFMDNTGGSLWLEVQ